MGELLLLYTQFNNTFSYLLFVNTEQRLDGFLIHVWGEYSRVHVFYIMQYLSAVIHLYQGGKSGYKE